MNQLLDILTEIQSFIERGGDVLFVIFVVTLIMWILILERVVYFQLVHPLRLKKTVRHWESRSEKSSWYAKKIRELEVSQISHKLNHSLPMIKTLVMLCPLLGLLGTVTGMIEVFDIMAIVGSGNARAMASGVSKATIPTMAGMVAALSGIYFSARLDRTAKKKIAHVEDCLTQE